MQQESGLATPDDASRRCVGKNKNWQFGRGHSGQRFEERRIAAKSPTVSVSVTRTTTTIYGCDNLLQEILRFPE